MSRVIFNFLCLVLLCMTGTLSASCIFEVTKKDTKYVYDLSSLETNVHETKFHFKTYDVIMYFSLCKPLQLSPVICPDLNSKICIVKSLAVKPFIPDAGSVIISSGMKDDNLHLKFSSETPCQKNGHNYSTIINFSCKNDKSLIELLEYEKETCTFNLLWITPAACPMKFSDVADSCVFEQKGHVFDFRSLRHPQYYVVPYKNSLYWEMNICGSVNNGNCSGEMMFCQIDRESCRNSTDMDGHLCKSSVVGTSSHIKFVNETNSFKFIYATNDKYQIEMKLMCNYEVISAKPESVTTKKDLKKNWIKFLVKTPLGCMPEKPADCWVSQNGVKYDASPLHLPKNYKIQGPLNATFLINFCGPLVRDALWPGGLAAAGILFNNGSVKNLGMHVGPPEIDKFGKMLILKYKGGDLCNSTKRITTEIKISCADKETDIFFEKFEDCKYVFNTNHPAVCPIQAAEALGCEIQEPISARKINLNHKDLVINVNTKNQGFSFRFNLCSLKNEKCNGEEDASVCFIQGSKEIIIGKKSSQKLIYESGSIYFNLTGNECRKNVSSQVRVNVLCDYSASDDTKPEFQLQDDDCVFYFTWFTKKACPPRKTIPCIAVDEFQHRFNLSSLTLHDRNYHTRSDDALFLINVCGSLWFGKNEMCPYPSGACVKVGNEFRSIGQVKYPPRVINESLILKYEDGAICREKTDGALYERTTIKFICDSKESGPEFVQYNHCEYHFNWRTNLACFKNEVKRSDVPFLDNFKSVTTRSDHEPCKTHHPVYNFPFDLSPLRNRTYEVIGENNSNYRISVCEDLGKYCPNGSGVCRTSGSRVSLGSANDHLIYKNGQLYLNYTDGGFCDGGKKHFTVVNFTCCSKNCPAGPSDVQKISECQHVVAWRTKYACTMVDCTANSTDLRQRVDLSVLRKIESNYKINISDAPVLINVCSPLVPEKGLNCPPESSACVVGPSSEKSRNIGVSLSNPVVNNNKTVSLKYHFGSNCPDTRGGENYGSSFTFECNRTIGVGAPVYKNISDECIYVFEWQTSVVCPDMYLKFSNSNCSLVNPDTGKILDLNRVWENGPIEVKSNSKKYFVNLCLKKSQCGSALCSEEGESWVSYGQLPDTPIFSFNYNTTTFILTDGASCDKTSKSYHSEIRLRCTENMEDPQTGWSVITEENCKIVLEWRSAAACYITPDQFHSKFAYKLRTILMSTISGILILLMCGILVVRYVKKNNLNLNIPLSSWRSRSFSDTSDVVYTRVGATEEATLRLGGRTPDQPTETDSDEELLRLV